MLDRCNFNKDDKILFLGAGSAAHGIADLLCYAMKEQGLTDQEARDRCWLFDTKGLVVKKRERLEDFKKPYAKSFDHLESFVECIEKIKPTAIVGSVQHQNYLLEKSSRQ